MADAKAMAYSMMFQRYPVDAVREVTARLRPDGWLPAVDTLEHEIREVLAERIEICEALENGEVYTAEQLWEIENRRLGYVLNEKLSVFPIWDRGKEAHRKRWETARRELRQALTAFTHHNAEPSDWIDRRTVKNAEDTLAAPFMPYPSAETPKERQDRMKTERETMETQKAAKIEALLKEEK